MPAETESPDPAEPATPTGAEADPAATLTAEPISIQGTEKGTGLKGLARVIDIYRRGKLNRRVTRATIGEDLIPRLDGEEPESDAFVTSGVKDRRKERRARGKVERVRSTLDGTEDMASLHAGIVEIDNAHGGYREYITPAIRRQRRRELKRDKRMGRITKKEYKDKMAHVQVGHWSRTGKPQNMPSHASKVEGQRSRAKHTETKLRDKFDPAVQANTMAAIQDLRANMANSKAKKHGDKAQGLRARAEMNAELADVLEARLGGDAEIELTNRPSWRNVRANIRNRWLMRRADIATDPARNPLRRASEAIKLDRDITRLRDRSRIDKRIARKDRRRDQHQVRGDAISANSQSLREFEPPQTHNAEDATEQRIAMLERTVATREQKLPYLKEQNEKGEMTDLRYQRYVIELLLARHDLASLQGSELSDEHIVSDYMPGDERSIRGVISIYATMLRNLYKRGVKPTTEYIIIEKRLKGFKNRLNELEAQKMQDLKDAIALEQLRIAKEAEDEEKEARRRMYP